MGINSTSKKTEKKSIKNSLFVNRVSPVFGFENIVVREKREIYHLKSLSNPSVIDNDFKLSFLLLPLRQIDVITRSKYLFAFWL